MTRHHFKELMFTPDFVKRSRQEMGAYKIEKRVEKIFMRPFRAIRRLWLSKQG
jgi:hypothetical protein